MQQIKQSVENSQKVKIAIIGAGTAGLSARREVSKLTDDYLVFDGGDMGTTCARVGCMPSKVLIQAANDFARRKTFVSEGIHGAEHLSINTKEVMGFVRQLRDRFVRGVFSDMDDWQDKLVREYVEFVDANTLKTASGKLIHAEKVIIATGSTPIIPGPWRAHNEHIITTDQFFELDNIPEKLVVIGLGVIGIELGQAIARLGADVTLVGLGKSIGGLTDPEIQSYVADKFSQELNISYEGADIVGVSEDNKLMVNIDGEIKLFDKALLAIGRAPNLTQLGLDKLGIKMDRGLPNFSSTTFQLDSYPHIYLVGDTNGERPLLHEAADQGRIAGFNAVRDQNQCFAKRVSLGITFSDPNIATVGMRYQQLVDANSEFVTGKVSFEGQGRSIVKSKEQGLLHLYARASDGKTSWRRATSARG